MDYIPECYQKSTLILGCGNILFGDDGFGPAVITYLEKHYQIPEDIAILDVGTGAREILFNIALAEKKPKRVIVIDALDCHRPAGEIFTVPVESLPEKKIDDFSLHQMPTSNLLKELKDLCQVEVVLLAAQPKYIPEIVKPGLSKKIQDAVPKVGKYIVKNYFWTQCTNGI
jgi:coenzyme F420 hydrogenase subunit delta